MTSPTKYQFVVQGGQEDWYPIDFRRPADDSGRYLSGIWQRLSASVEKATTFTGDTPDAWVRWEPWKWCGQNKPGYENRISWIAWCGTSLVGFLNVWPGYQSQHESGQDILYIEHLAAFPGDQTTLLWTRRYKHVGKALLAYAINLSHEAGYGGRIGLHSENDRSSEFYHRMANRREVELYHPERTGIIGPTPHGTRSDPSRLYLEMTSKGAMDFLEDYRHE